MLPLSGGTYSRLLLLSNQIKMIVVGWRGLRVVSLVVYLTGYEVRGNLASRDTKYISPRITDSSAPYDTRRP